MNQVDPTRREFVTISARLLGGGLLGLQFPAMSALAGCAREAATAGAEFETLTSAEASAMRALAARIIPSDDSLPGAEEAGAVYFVDLAVSRHFPDARELVAEGLANLDTRARVAGADSFAEAGPDAQDAIIRAIEDTPFFGFAHMLTVCGVFAHPDYRGNRNGVSARILGYAHEPGYQPPFGYYDAEAARGASGGAA